MKKRSNHAIGLDAMLLALYFALTPIHQTLRLSNGGTIVKYLALLVMVGCVLQGYIRERRFVVIWDVIWPILMILAWFVLTLVWARSRSTSIANLSSIGSYFALMLIVGSRRWTNEEMRLFLNVLVFSCVFYAFLLIGAAAVSRRATLTFSVGEDENEADQNLLSCNLGIGALAGVLCFLDKKRGQLRWVYLGCVMAILAGILSTGSRGALLAFAVGVCYLFYRHTEGNPVLRIKGILMIAAGAVFLWLVLALNLLQNETIQNRYSNVSLDSASSRFEIWSQYLEMLIKRPIGFLCGYGVGCDTLEHADFMGRDWLRASHNDPISLICQVGIPGVFLVGAFVWHVWQTGRRDKNAFGGACILLMLVGSLDVNLFKTYGWWNAMLFAYIGVGKPSILARRPFPQQLRKKGAKRRQLEAARR